MTNELLAILMSWAVTLSWCPQPAQMPVIERVSHAWLVDRACHGRECKVIGWYERGPIIYIDARLEPETSVYDSSIVVHEMVHYLQAQRGAADAGAYKFLPSTCKEAIAMEVEAYGVQREYILRYGEYFPIGISMHNVGCENEEQAK